MRRACNEGCGRNADWRKFSLVDVKKGLERLDQSPFVHGPARRENRISACEHLVIVQASKDIHLFAEDILEHVDRFAGQHRDDLVLVVNCRRRNVSFFLTFHALSRRRNVLTVTTVLLRVLVRGVFNLDRNTGADLVLLDDLLRFVVDLERRAALTREWTSVSS